MERRRFLVAGSGALVGISGCSNLGGVGGSGTTTTTSKTADRPPADDALVIDSSIAVEGTNVNIGVEGTAKNTASTALVECVVVARGKVGGKTYEGTTRRDRLDPKANWEWYVKFGEEADASSDDTVDSVVIETRAEYADT